MKVLITGGCGFLGKHLVAALLDSGVAPDQINVVSRSYPQNRNNTSCSINCIAGDIVDELPKTAFDGVSAVFHLAAIKGIPRKQGEVLMMRRINIEGTQNLISECEKHGIKRFVFFSSTSVYGDTKGVVDENSAVDPITTYAKTKLQGEKIVLGLNSDGVKIQVLRISNVFGEYSPEKPLLGLVRQVKSGRFRFIGKRNGLINYVYAGDVAQVVVDGEFAKSHGIFIVNTPTNMIHLVNTIATDVGARVPSHVLPYSAAYGIAALLDVFGKIARRNFPLSCSRVKAFAGRAEYSSEKLRAFCPIFPTHGFEEGLRRTIDYYRSQQWL